MKKVITGFMSLAAYALAKAITNSEAYGKWIYLYMQPKTPDGANIEFYQE